MIIGMDFGTTNSGIATFDGKQLQLIPIDANAPNATIARTALYITNNRQIFIGREAIDTYYEQNLNRPVSIERVRVGEITLTFAELPTFIRDVYIEKDMLSPGRLFVSFKTALSSLNYLGTVVGTHFYFLEDIIAMYLLIAKQRAEQTLKKEVKSIVLGRPVHFSMNAEGDQLAQERLLKAAFRAGYEEVYLQYEPIAAAYHYESFIDREQHVLVFDFGGGTLDISVLRIGNPKTREVLATGGVPIAGDIFDQKLVRAKFPQHFGEGSTYRSGDKTLPVPSSFYEAFANWQDLLALQRPEFYEHLDKIEKTAQKPHQIKALRNLVSSSYGLKMFDVMEASKRQLSKFDRTTVRFETDHFKIYEPASRTEFERIIRPEIQQIESHLNSTLEEAGLKPKDIDIVIRTGGSSEIPAFVQILEDKFGADKVRSLDTFSSVTSGLGVIAHRIERGETEAQVHRATDYQGTNRVRETPKNGVAPVDFDLLKKFITATERSKETQEQLGLVALTGDKQVVAAIYEPEGKAKNSLMNYPLERVISIPADEPILVCTSEYRFFRKTPRQLANLNDAGINLDEAEGFHKDVFGDEYVSGVARSTAMQTGHPVMLLTTSSHFKVFAETLITRLEQPVPYQATRLKGDPMAFVAAPIGGEVIAFSASGRAVRVKSSLVGMSEGRLFNLSANDEVVAVHGITEPTQFLLIASDGKAAVISSDEIPLAQTLRTTGSKLPIQRSLTSVILWNDQFPLQAVTSQRIVFIERLSLDEPQRIVKLKKGETLAGIMTGL